MVYHPVYIDLAEFRKSGKLKEVNEQYFWPKGMALTFEVDDDGSERISGIQVLPVPEDTPVMQEEKQ